MLAEIQGIHILLKRWNKNPDGPASEISPFSADHGKNRPFTRAETTRAAAVMRKHAPTATPSLTAMTGIDGMHIRQPAGMNPAWG